MNTNFEELDISVDDSFDSICNSCVKHDFPVAYFGKEYILLNIFAKMLLNGVSYVSIRKNDKYVVILPEKIESRYTYRISAFKGSNITICAKKGVSSGFYSSLWLGKYFKVKKIKSGGVAICLEEEIA